MQRENDRLQRDVAERDRQLAERTKQIADAVNDPVWSECVAVGSKATGLRHLFTPTVEEQIFQGTSLLLSGKGKAEEVLARVDAASKAVGKRQFTVPPWTM